MPQFDVGSGGLPAALHFSQKVRGRGFFAPGTSTLSRASGNDEHLQKRGTRPGPNPVRPEDHVVRLRRTVGEGQRCGRTVCVRKKKRGEAPLSAQRKSDDL